MSAAIPVTVVTGFLGAGKTTLVNEWLGRERRGDVAVIVNEHGDVGIDGELLGARAQVLVEITGGCVCCTTQAELVRALAGIAAAPVVPRRVLVETSGAASPAGVLRAIGAGAGTGAFLLDGVITVVDAVRIEELADHDLAYEQLGYADVVVLSRADACTPAMLEHASRIVARRNGAALVARAERGVVRAPPATSLDGLLAARRSDLPVMHAAPPARTSHVYESVALAHDGDVDADRLADFMEDELARVAGRIFRTKGILAVRGMAERMIVQGVADSVEVTFGEPWGAVPRTSRLVVVGFGLDAAALAAAFRACAAEPA
ncbi:MAG: putative metal chaperone, involved in Zn homeostasis [Labilithrix sp.]|nr:putative metal chaperone, involved in Zn homeostasis [Labilithrix sp.]